MGIWVVIRFHVDEFVIPSAGPPAGVGQGGVDKRDNSTVAPISGSIHAIFNLD